MTIEIATLFTGVAVIIGACIARCIFKASDTLKNSSGNCIEVVVAAKFFSSQQHLY